MHIPDKYYSKLGKRLAMGYLIIATIILLLWYFTPDNMMECGAGGPFSLLGGELCFIGTGYHLTNTINIVYPHHGIVSTIIFSFPIFPSILLNYIFYITTGNYSELFGSDSTFYSFNSYFISRIGIWLVSMTLNAFTLYVFGFLINKIWDPFSRTKSKK